MASHGLNQNVSLWKSSVAVRKLFACACYLSVVVAQHCSLLLQAENPFPYKHIPVVKSTA